MANDADPYADVPMTFQIEDLGYVKEFKTYSEIAKWAASEKEEWQALNSIKLLRNNSLLKTVISHQQNIWNQLHDQAAAAQNQPQRRGNVRNFLTQISDGLRVVSDTPIGRKILSNIDSDPEVALGQLMFRMHDQQFPLNFADDLPELMRIAVGALLHEKSGVGDVEAEKAALSGLKKRWEGKFSQFWKTQHEEETRISASYAQGMKLARKLLMQIKSFGWAHRRATAEIELNHTERMTAMETAFSTDMKLRASEKFWGAKRRVHERRSRTALRNFIIACFVAPFGLVAVYSGVEWVIGTPSAQFETSHIFYFGIPTVIVLWAIKHLAGYYLMHRELAADAEERVAMVHTFKALEYEGRASEEERLVVLQALFRPHQSAVDDSVPNPLWDAIFKRLDSRP